MLALETDYTFPASGVTFTRHYSSTYASATSNGEFEILATGADQQTSRYRKKNGAWVGPAALRDALRQTASGYELHKDANGSVRRYHYEYTWDYSQNSLGGLLTCYDELERQF